MFIKNLLKTKNRIHQKYFTSSYNEISLLSGLTRFGIEKGMSIFIHSSLSKLGDIQGGANTVINALIAAVGSEGTIIMPGFTVRKSMHESLNNLEKNNIVFDYKIESPLVGAIPKTFFGYMGVYRSVHPTHSVLAIGEKARFITEGHEDCNTTFGVGTPLYKLIDSGSYIMGLGSDISHVTFYHVLEDLNNSFPVEVYEDKEYRIKLLINNEIKSQSYRCHKNQKLRIEMRNGAWVKAYFERYFLKRGVLIKGKVGNAECWMIKAKDLYNCIEDMMKNGITIYSPAPNLLLKLFYGYKWVVYQLRR